MNRNFPRLQLFTLLALASCGGRGPAVTAEADSAPATPPWPPTFEQYATTDTLTGPPAPLDYSGNPDARRFRSQLAGWTTADFAGHFVFVVWGCGTNCTSHMVLDLRTGRPYDDTLVNFSCGSASYLPTSALIISTPDTSLDASERCRLLPTRYFLWGGTSLRELTGSSRESAPIRVSDSVLRIPLAHGDTITLTGHPADDEQFRSYTYLRRLSTAPFHLVEVHYYETVRYELYHEATGKRSRIGGLPLVSHRGTRVVATESLGAVSEEGGGIWIYQLSGDSLIQLWKHDEDDWGSKDPVWAGEDTILFIRNWRDRQNGGAPEAPAALVHTSNGWEVSGPRPDTFAISPPARINDRDLMAAGIAYKDDSNLVRRRLGAPDSVAKEAWYYRDLTVYYLEGARVEQILLRTPRYATIRGLRVGDPVTKAKELYGRDCIAGELMFCHPAGDDGFDERGMNVENDGTRITGIRIGAVFAI